MDKKISIRVEQGNALQTECDVLVLKYAQALHGVDEAAVGALISAGFSIGALPEPDQFLLIPTEGVIAPRAVLFIGVPQIWKFHYAEIRGFGSRALSYLMVRPTTRRVVLTVHGPNYGLDESESMRAELAGFLDSIARHEYPLDLESIVIVERELGRAERLKGVLCAALPKGSVTAGVKGVAPALLSEVRHSLADVGEGSRQKPHVFAAMPFAKEFDDRFHYGIQRAAESVGFLCERADLTSFVGDVLSWVRERIDSAAFVIADLTTANPNVYLEVGYAWGRDVPTVLLVSDAHELKFDVHSQRCLIYDGSIRRLEELLAAELNALSRNYRGGLTGG
jgi:hypothetical protein